MRLRDASSLDCLKCKRLIEIPVADVREGRLRCPFCDHVHQIDWRPADPARPAV